MNNSLGIHYGVFVTNWKDDQHYLIKKVKSLGFDLLEFGAPWLAEQSDASIAEFRKTAEGEGVEIALSLGLGVHQDISSEDSAIRATGLKLLTDLAGAMVKVGAESCAGIIHGAWNGRIASYAEKAARWDHSVSTMKKAAAVFASEGVMFNVEVVNRFENFLINDCAEALKYVRDVGSPNLGIHLDTFHINIEENSFTEAISLAGDKLRHFHIGENNRKFPGMGMLPWKEIFASLEAMDYKGPIAMEPFVRPGGEVGSDVSLFRELMDTSRYDEDIRQSAAFVRGLMA